MQNETSLINYAVVENDVIVNILVFDNEETAEEFGCLPLVPHQQIGDTYISPEEWSKQEAARKMKQVINAI